MTEITNYINTDFRAIDSQETIVGVQSFLEELSFSHFPVLNSGTYIGSIVSDDLETFDGDKKVSDYQYTLENFFVKTSMTWLEVLEIFAKNQTNLVPVLDEENNYIGYYEMEDIVNIFYETPFLKQPGGIIIVQKEALDYSMSQIAQIVESNNGSILGLFISEINLETVQITLKINLGSMNEIIQTFRRYNYVIISEHQEDNYINNLKERSEYLNKYLNI
jgi:CBS domain containing-hemolysin-like protein